MISCKHEPYNPFQLFEEIRNEGFEIVNVKEYVDQLKSGQSKAIIRFDVHHRDIEFGYEIAEYLSQNDIPKDFSFYVMWNMPIQGTQEVEESFADEYTGFIKYLQLKGFDVQPHISVVDLLANNYYPEWNTYDRETAQKLFDENYKWVKNTQSFELEVIGTDTLKLLEALDKIPLVLTNYAMEWEKAFGFVPSYYASHGTNHILHKVGFNNAYLGFSTKARTNSDTLSFDLYSLIYAEKCGYCADTNNDYESMFNCIKEDKNSKEILIHPYLMNKNNNLYRDQRK